MPDGLFKTYYALTKPGIIYGNSLSVIAGFLLAAQGSVHLGTFGAALVGSALVMASGCVYNNYIDRSVDAAMVRTKQRALVRGSVSGPQALAYATLLGMAGFTLLALRTNELTVAIGFTGLLLYVVVYGIAKRRSTLGTVIGSLSGAIPPVAGYTAASGQLDTAALILFLILVCWQMPHFYAIAMYRRHDYAAAHLPVLPVVKGMRRTKLYILWYIIAFIAAALALPAFGYAGYTYTTLIIVLGAVWLYSAGQGFRAADNERWARRMFGRSLLVLLILTITISLEAWLP